MSIVSLFKLNKSCNTCSFCIYFGLVFLNLLFGFALRFRAFNPAPNHQFLYVFTLGKTHKSLIVNPCQNQHVPAMCSINHNNKSLWPPEKETNTRESLCDTHVNKLTSCTTTITLLSWVIVSLYLFVLLMSSRIVSWFIPSNTKQRF